MWLRAGWCAVFLGELCGGLERVDLRLLTLSSSQIIKILGTQSILGANVVLCVQCRFSESSGRKEG